MHMRIGIVGAGPAGIVTARVLAQAGHDVRVFEAGSGLGGVWRKDRIFEGATTQTGAAQFCFSEMPIKTKDLWATAEEMQDYFEAYAKRFGLMPLIQLNTVVSSVAPEGGKWKCTFSHGGKEGTDTFDAFVVANGVFEHPFIPDVFGPHYKNDRGDGLPRVIHTSDVRAAHEFEGKKVVVVGFARSAAEIAVLLANGHGKGPIAKTTTLLFRRPEWKSVRYIEKKDGTKEYLMDKITSRMNFLMLHPNFLSTGFWKMISGLIAKQQHLEELGLLPSETMFSVRGCAMSVEPVDFYKSLGDGRIKYKKGEAKALKPGHVVLEDGTELEADVVILGTGFDSRHIPFFSDEINAKLIDPETNLFSLYRQVVPPGLPNLYFNGYNSALLSPVIFEIAANWMARYIDGRIKVPTSKMEKVIKADHSQRAVVAGGRANGGVCAFPDDLSYIDLLMRDMRLPARVRKNPIVEFFAPFDPSAYAPYLYGNGERR
jgi:dimethylaniline monooxygenase (N-oxide forming)